MVKGGYLPCMGLVTGLGSGGGSGGIEGYGRRQGGWGLDQGGNKYQLRINRDRNPIFPTPGCNPTAQLLVCSSTMVV